MLSCSARFRLGSAQKGGYRPRSYRGWVGGDAIPFLRSCRGTRRTRTLRSSLLRGGERPGRHPDVASGGYSYPAPARLGASRGGAVSSVVTSGCPKRSEGGFPVGTRTNAVPHAQNMLKREMLLPYLQDTEGAFSIGGLLSNAEVAQQERIIPRNLTPTHWSMQIPSARGTKSACGRVYAVGVSTAYSVTPRLLSRNA